MSTKRFSPSMLTFDQQHIWHPYASMATPLPVYPVVSASGVRLKLADGRELVDGMASWWCAIHGYNHPVLNQAAKTQLDAMSHVMFGGITHAPAVQLAEQLMAITPLSLSTVFFSDSGSVAVEIAIKMVIQYWQSCGQPQKHRLLALRGAYHGDTLGAMAVCDPVNGMHHLFSDALPQHYFADRPRCRFGETFDPIDLASFKLLIDRHHRELAAVIIEPIVQGAGGMHFYSPAYVTAVRTLCDEYDVLLIADEIATGFGRTGRMFACEHAGIAPDIMCLGKALTGGYLSLAVTLCNDRVKDGISTAGSLMHGPTFMANPLACAIALASVKLLLSQPWQARIKQIEQQLRSGLAAARSLPAVADVRVLGAIGVIELHEPIDVTAMQRQLVDAGVWVRPFGKLLYVMPPYIISDADLATLTSAMVGVLKI